MSKDETSDISRRLRIVRKEILRITQAEMAEKLGVARTLVTNMESGKQGPSRDTLQKLYELWSINSNWMLHGEGAPQVTAQEPLNAIASPTPHLKMLDKVTLQARNLITNPQFYRERSMPGRFGYVPLSGTKVRFHAIKDVPILGSNLFQIAEDDRLWFLAGEPSGWEFEMLREYFDFGQDREMSEWMEFLRIIRWEHSLLTSAETGLLSQDEKTA